MDLEEFKDLITTEINRESSIRYRYPDNIEPAVNLGLTMALGIVIVSYNNTSVNTEKEFTSVVIKNIEHKKNDISEDEDEDQTDTSYILLGMDTACDIVREMLDKINGD